MIYNTPRQLTPTQALAVRALRLAHPETTKEPTLRVHARGEFVGRALLTNTAEANGRRLPGRVATALVERGLLVKAHAAPSGDYVDYRLTEAGRAFPVDKG